MQFLSVRCYFLYLNIIWIHYLYPNLCTVSLLIYFMVLKTISPGCGVWASLMLFFFCTFGSATSSHNFVSIFCFDKYGQTLHYRKLEKNFISPGNRFTEGSVIIYTNISIIYENGFKFASFENNCFLRIIPNIP